MTEQELIKSCIRNDRRAQKELYDRFAPLMYAICIRYTHNSTHAGDVLQDGFIKVFSNLERFRFAGSFEGWLKRIFVNTAITQYHKVKSMQEDLTVDEELSDVVSHAVSAIEKLSEKELLTMIAALPDGYRMVFNLHVLEGFDHEEIAGMLHIKPSTSRSQLVKARKMLQQRIIEQKLTEA